MARPKSTDTPDLDTPVNLTAGVIDRLRCPPDKPQVFLRDKLVTGLKVRATKAGAKAFVFERRVNGVPTRVTIGSCATWSTEDARAEARRLSVNIDRGVDPRAEKRTRMAEATAAATAAQPALVTWASYIEARKGAWGVRHCEDHEKLAAPGGRKVKRGTRGTGVTKAGVLHALLQRPLGELTAENLATWAAVEGVARPTQARLGLRLLRAFLAWAAEQPELTAALPPGDPAKARRVREPLGTSKAKSDALLREQLSLWFGAVRALPNPAVSAYLQILLLVGSRPGELRELRWEDVNWQWRGLTIRDKVEGTRVIPLTPYVASLLGAVPRRGPFVFASGPDKPIATPNHAHHTACAAAGVGPVTLHGLRRSFKSLTEWLEMPAGVVAQIMGHKPSATAERHYTVRPLDLLRLHHERIEAWVLEQAGLPVPAPDRQKLRAV